MYPCVALGLLVLARRRHPARDRAGLIDALVVCDRLRDALVGLPDRSLRARRQPVARASASTSIAYPVMDLLLLGVAVRLLLGGGRRGTSSHLLAAALVALLGADAAYGWLSINGGYDPGGLLDGAWIAFYVLIGTAALHPSMRALSEPAPGGAAAPALTRSRLAAARRHQRARPGRPARPRAARPAARAAHQRRLRAPLPARARAPHRARAGRRRT